MIGDESHQTMHVCLGTPAHHLDALIEDAQLGCTEWTINSSAKKGDVALFYMTRPTSAIVGRGVVLKDAARVEEEGNDWEGFHMAEIGELEIFPEPITLAALKTEIPGWRYWLSPVRSHRVPEQHLKALKRLLKRARGA